MRPMLAGLTAILRERIDLAEKSMIPLKPSELT